MKKIFLFGFICGLVFTFGIQGGLAEGANFLKSIDVYQYPITFFFNGEEQKVKDAEKGYYHNGMKEVPLSFIYEGTTYVPIRYVSELFGKEIGWDSKTYSIWIGKKPAALESKTNSEISGIEKGSSIYGITLNDSIDEVMKILGDPVRKDSSHIGVEWWIYNRDQENYLQIGIANGKVATLYSNGLAWNYKGLAIGSTIDDIKKIFGEPKPSIEIISGVTMYGNQFGEKVVYKTDEGIVLFYLDQHDQNRIRGIRIFTPELFAKTAVHLHYKISYYNEKNVQLPNLSDHELKKVETAYEQQVVDLTNVIRKRNGLSKLSYNPKVAEIAKSHSLDMFRNHFFSHTSPTTGDPSDRLKLSSLPSGAFGENIAAGYLDAIDVVEGWMNSSGHRKNILNSYADEIGVGIILGDNGSYNSYYTQNFYGK